MDSGYLFKQPKELEKQPDIIRVEHIDVREMYGNQFGEEVQQPVYSLNSEQHGQSDEDINVEQTRLNALEIKSMMDSLELGEFKVSEVEAESMRLKLSAAQGRNLSYLMMNDRNRSSDSKEMASVKTALSNLEQTLAKRNEKGLSAKDVEDLDNMYREAVNACRYYVDVKNPWTTAGKIRKSNVQTTLNRLLREADTIEIAKHVLYNGGEDAKQIKSGMDLLTYGAVTAMSEGFMRRNLFSEKKELSSKINLMQNQIGIDEKYVNEVQDDINELLDRKYPSIFSRFGIENSDPEYKALLEKKQQRQKERKLVEQKAELNATKSRLAELDKEEENIAKEKKDALEARHERLKDKTDADKLPENLRRIAKVFSEGGAPSSIIQNIKKPKAVEKKLISEVVTVRNELMKFKDGQLQAKTVRIGDSYVRFFQDHNGLLEMQAGGITVPFNYSAQQLSADISRDIVSYPDLYGDATALNVMKQQKDDLDNMTCSDLLNTREYAAEILHQKVGVEKSLLNNISVEMLKEFAVACIEQNADLSQLKAKIDSAVKTINSVQKEGTINTVLNLEMQKVSHKNPDGVVLELKKKEDNSGFSSNEEKVRDFIADMIFSQDTLSADELQYQPGERIKHVIMQNSEAIALIIADQFRKGGRRKSKGLVEGVFDTLPLFMLSDKESLSELKNGLQQALDKLRDSVAGQIKENTDPGFMRDVAMSGLSSAKLMQSKIADIIGKMDGKVLGDFAEIEKSIDESVSSTMESVQKAFSTCVDELFSKDKEDTSDDGANVTQVQKIVPDEVKAYKAAGDEMSSAEAKLKEYKESVAECQEKIAETRKIIEELNEKRQTLSDKDDKEIVSEEIRGYKKLLAGLQETEIVNREASDGQQQLVNKMLPSFRKKRKAAEAAERRLRIREIQERMAKRKAEVEADEELKALEVKEAANKALLKKNYNRLSDEDKRKYDDLEQDKNGERKELQEKIRSLRYRSKEELHKILNDAAKGDKGQGLFTKNVLKTYFGSMPVQDQRSMLAGALRNCKAVNLQKPDKGTLKKDEEIDYSEDLQELFSEKSSEQTEIDYSEDLQRLFYEDEYLKDKEKEQDSDGISNEEKLNMMSDVLGGMFKGAGPLFQKMLQGLPAHDFSEGLKKAIADTQDNLASIPEQIVRNHMNSIIARSNGKVEKIEVKKSLGAASVGQAFLCRIYGPDTGEDGRDVVIKLLRPDARNRMMREREIMLNAARMTDRAGKLESEIQEMEERKQIGGMEATYLGNLARIEEELDLTIEVKNCKIGEVYDKEIKGKEENLAHAMKMSTVADASSDTCIMEMAGSKTVKRYMSDVRDLMTEKIRPFCQTEIEKDENGIEHQVLKKDAKGSYILKTDMSSSEKIEIRKVFNELNALLDDVESRQEGILQLAQKWVTEGVYEKGYYHGDLHAGNIMISDKDKGVTAIDFGNATQISEEQQKHVTIMMTAAAIGDADMFQDSFHELLQNTPESVYQEKKEELNMVLKDIMSMGSEQDSGERIGAALVRAQELGLELPSVIANFSSGQIRLENTVKSMNSLYVDLRNNVVKLSGVNSMLSDELINADPVQKAIEDGRYKNEQERKLVFARELRRLELTKKEDFIDRLKNMDSDDEFSKLYDIPIIDGTLEKDLARINEIIATKTLTEYEKNVLENCSVGELFKGIDNYMKQLKGAGEEAQMQLSFVNQVINRLETYLYDPGEPLIFYDENLNEEQIDIKSLDHLAEQIAERTKQFNGFKFTDKHTEASELQKKMSEFRKAQKENATADEINAMAAQVWELYQKECGKKEEAYIKEETQKVNSSLEKLLPDPKLIRNVGKKNEYAKQLDMLKITIENCEESKICGDEIKKEKEIFLDLFKKSIETPEACEANEVALKESLRKISGLLNTARIERLRDLMNNAEDDKSYRFSREYDNEDPDDFVSVMATIITNHKLDTAKRLGYFKALKIKNMLGGDE